MKMFTTLPDPPSTELDGIINKTCRLRCLIMAAEQIKIKRKAKVSLAGGAFDVNMLWGVGAI